MVEVLFQKSLHKQCWLLLDKAQRIANNHELFLAQMEINSWRLKLQNIVGDPVSTQQVIAEQRQTNQNLARQWENNWEYDALATALDAQTRLHGYHAVFPDHPLLENITAAQSNTARMKFYRLHASRLMQQHRYAEALKHLAGIVSTFEEAKEIPISQQKNYFSAFCNYIYGCRLANEYQLAMAIAQRLRNRRSMLQGEKPSRTTANNFLACMNAQLDLAKEIGDLGLLTELPQADSALKKYFPNIRAMHRLAYLYLSGQMHFISENYREAIRRFYLLSLQPEGKVRSDLLRFSRLLLLLSHYKMGNLDTLATELRSANRFFKQQATTYQMEKEMLRFLKVGLKKIPGTPTWQQNLDNLITKCETLKQDQQEGRVRYYFDFVAFIKSERTGTPLQQTLRQQHAATTSS